MPVAGEALILGGLCAIAVALSSLLWHLWVHPDLVLSLLAGPADGAEEHGARVAAALRGLRLVAGCLVFGAGFAAGAAAVLIARSHASGGIGVPWLDSLLR